MPPTWIALEETGIRSDPKIACLIQTHVCKSDCGFRKHGVKHRVRTAIGTCRIDHKHSIHGGDPHPVRSVSQHLIDRGQSLLLARQSIWIDTGEAAGEASHPDCSVGAYG